MTARGPRSGRKTRNPPHTPFEAASFSTTPVSLESSAAQQLGVAEYIESICVELRMMARAAKLETLVYFLDMARIEATIQIESHGTLGKPSD